jgi:hypothetical protein
MQGDQLLETKIIFQVQGSLEEPYQVAFIRKGLKVTGLCDCEAGNNGMACKHRLRILLEGSSEGIISPNASEVNTVASWFPGSNIEAALKDLKSVEKEADKEIRAIKKRVSQAKKEFAKSLYG